jgi:hypothetical protein
MWLCPPPIIEATRDVSRPLPPHLVTAARFVASLGPGVNVMASNVRWGQLSWADYEGLAHRVSHVRLCGDFVVNLVDWTSCPGRNWLPDGAETMSEAQIQAAFRERIVTDPGFSIYKAAAREIVSHGLRLVLNPLHQKWAITLDAALVHRFWKVTLDEFTTVLPHSHVHSHLHCTPLS